jgi:hypothetical protein
MLEMAKQSRIFSLVLDMHFLMKMNLLGEELLSCLASREALKEVLVGSDT